MSTHLEADTDLSAIFGIEIDTGVDAIMTPVNVLCGKCKGRGNFLSYAGRVVGRCFACNGTGLAATSGVEIKEGACAKCAGSGEYRPGSKCFACNGSGKSPIAACGINAEAISAAFSSAHTNGIKAPKLRLDTFVFSRAPDTGRNAGSIYVKDRGDYIGKITDGRFAATFACDDATRDRVIAVACDPHGAAKAHGHKTGSCSCCGRELTEKLSVELGIGPICREKFGW